MKLDPFVGAIILIITIAYFLPISDPSIYKFLSIFSSWGVSIIFFLYGMKMKLNTIREGLSNWRLHLLIQSTTFILFPLMVILFLPLFSQGNNYLYWLAFMFLAAVPSTVSSSVVMVNIAKGNVTSAIFNASISGILGIFITPLWLNGFTDLGSENIDLSFVYKNLLLEILLPIVLGLLCQKWGHHWVIKHSKWLNLWDKFIILVIVFKSFSYSFNNGLFSDVSIVEVVFILLGVLFIFGFIFYFLKFISRILKFNFQDQITAQFCGTKKSLVHGTVFSNAIFSNSSSLGIILLPLMLYHALQILIIGAVANKYLKRDLTHG